MSNLNKINFSDAKLLSDLKQLNNKFNLKEELRSCFAGFVLIALRYGFNLQNVVYTDTLTILANLSSFVKKSVPSQTLFKPIDDFFNKDEVLKINAKDLIEIIDFINKNIYPYINIITAKGQDLLTLFFNVFNKYSTKKDHNQAFTPSYIGLLMAKMIKLSHTDKILDPTAGSGTFLSQSIAYISSNTKNKNDLNDFINNNLFGIEYDEQVFLLLLINVLLHNSTNFHLFNESCFNKLNTNYFFYNDVHKSLMNPPFNSSQVFGLPNDCPVYQGTKQKANSDATKGLYFVYKTANAISYQFNYEENKPNEILASKPGLLATILPIQCAKGGKSFPAISKYKKLMMQKHSLLAVCTLSINLFYGVGAETCLMIWKTGVPHNKETTKTFLGNFKDDGYVVAKHLNGRVRVKNTDEIMKNWLNLYENGLDSQISINVSLDENDNWLPSCWLKQEKAVSSIDLKESVDDYFIHLASIKEEKTSKQDDNNNDINFSLFKIGDFFNVKNGKRITKTQIKKHPGNIAVIGGGGSATSLMGYADDSFIKDKVYSNKPCLTVARNGSVGSVNLYLAPIYCSDSAFILEPKGTFSISVLIYFKTALNKLKDNYSYGNSILPNEYLLEEIALPSKKINNKIQPDFKKMEEAVEILIKDKEEVIEKIKQN